MHISPITGDSEQWAEENKTDHFPSASDMQTIFELRFEGDHHTFMICNLYKLACCLHLILEHLRLVTNGQLYY